MQPVTNLTELWQDPEKTDALLLCAKPTTESDFALFAALCEAFAQMPGHPARLRAEAQLRTLFACDLPPLPENRDVIWRLTAEALLLHPIQREAAARVPIPGPVPDVPLPPLPRAPLAAYPDLPEFPARTVAEWEPLADGWIGEQSGAKGIALSFPAGFRAKKPSRYAADRHLTGTAPDPDLWTAQTFRFLRHVLRKTQKTLLLKTACPAREIAALFALFAAGDPFPPILWLPDDPAEAVRAADLVRAYPAPDLTLAVLADPPADLRALARAFPIGRVLELG